MHRPPPPTANFNLISDNSDPTGIAFGDGKFWVVDSAADEVYAYNIDGTLDSNSSFSLVAKNADPAGIAFGDNKFWVVDSVDDEVYAYNLDGTNNSASGFLLSVSYVTPTGIAFGDGRLWVADSSSSHCGDRRYSPNYCPEFLVYTTSGQHTDTYVASSDSTGIAFGNSMVWVSTDSFVSSYTTSGIIDFVSSFELQNSNDAAVGMVFGNDKLWVVDNDGTVYSYNVAIIPGFYITATISTGIAFGDGRLWVADSSSSHCGDRRYSPNYCPEFLVYTTSGQHTDSHNASSDSTGIAFGNSMVWVVNEIVDRVYAYESNGRSDSDSGFALDLENDAPAGMTFGDDKFWVVDHADDTVYAYSRNGTPDSNASFQLVSGNNDPTGIAFGDDKFWVVDNVDNVVYAYDSDGMYDSDSGFALYDGNRDPTGITFGDDKFWVVDSDYTVRTYTLGQRSPVPLPGPGLGASLEPRIVSLETKITNLETMLTDMKTMLSNFEGTITNLTTRIVALETGTPAPDPEPVSTTGITGKVYTDSNDNDTLDSGESGVSGRSVITVNLSDLEDISRTTTDANGDYSFEHDAGTYLVQVEGTNAFAYVTVLDGSITTQNLGL